MSGCGCGCGEDCGDECAPCCLRCLFVLLVVGAVAVDVDEAAGNLASYLPYDDDECDLWRE